MDDPKTLVVVEKEKFDERLGDRYFVAWELQDETLDVFWWGMAPKLHWIVSTSIMSTIDTEQSVIVVKKKYSEVREQIRFLHANKPRPRYSLGDDA